MKLRKKQNNNKQVNFQIEIEKKLKNEAFLDEALLMEELDASIKGLTNTEAEKRLLLLILQI